MSRKTNLKITLICEITVHGIRKKSIFLEVDLGSPTYQYTELYQLEFSIDHDHHIQGFLKNTYRKESNLIFIFISDY